MVSSSAFSPSPAIEQRGAGRVLAFVGCCVLLAIAGIALSALSGTWQVLAGLLVAASGGSECHGAWPGSPAYLRALRLNSDGAFECSLRQDRCRYVPATVRHWWTLGNRIAGLVLVDEAGRRSQAIFFRDLVPPDQWRQLLVCLRLGGRERGPARSRFT